MFADTEGNIGYMLVSSIPIRKNHHPLLGCRVLDGTTSMHDWEGYGDFSNLPFHINTDKGFYVTSNQRQYPDTARDDIGATHGSTARAQRLHHFIASKIKEGHKFSVKDNLAMQTDTMDVHAQRLVPHILKVTKDILANQEMKFDTKVRKDIQEMYEILEGSEIKKDGKTTGMFDGDMRADSVQASVYSLWHYYFYSSLLRAQTVLGATESKIMKDDEAFWNTKTRLSLIDNYAFTDFYQRLIEHLSQNPTSNKYDKIC
jgi:acyl-homoserine lactone acylase PvdQ